MGIKPGDEVVMVLEEGELRVLGARQAIARAQSLVRRYVPEGRCLSQELIQERREEASQKLGVTALTADKMWAELAPGASVT